MPADIQFESMGSMSTIQPRSQRGRDWVEQNVSFEPWQVTGGGNAVAVEPRCVESIMEGAASEGLEVVAI